MKIVSEEYISDESTSVALGFFDGVHLGHRQVILSATKQTENLLPCVFTFDTRPSDVVFNKFTPYIIDKEARNKKIKSLGVKLLVSANFKNIMELSCEEFVSEYLYKRLKAKKVFCGFNFTFGKNASGNADTLKEICQKFGINVTVVLPVKLENSEIISTSLIRKHIENGKIELANKMLLTPIEFTSKVVKGNQIGRTWGFPTANQLILGDVVCPKYGVYISKVSFENYNGYAITNIGVKPTIGTPRPLIESFMPFYTGEDIYGKTITTQLAKFIRPEKRFENIEMLKKQIQKDIDIFKIFMKNI